MARVADYVAVGGTGVRLGVCVGLAGGDYPHESGRTAALAGAGLSGIYP